MGHIPWEEMRERQNEALAHFPVDSMHQHSATGGVYRVLDHQIDEKTDEAMVVAENVMHRGIKIARFLSEWRSEVEINGEKVPRFVRLNGVIEPVAPQEHGQA